ncbi:5-oxoprolinase subunit PxpA [Kangiella sp. HD9-110m-PIT-SAG07]|nr:5-oxoprolinase subunit PxpA [Kangiella sp. HD9-110m-PIT-SAG07]
MNRTIDINCDLGESIESDDWARDAEIMPYISSCNIACGGHAGNEGSIRVSVQNAKAHNLAVGAHPSYPDKENFGRQSIQLSEKALRSTLKEQIQNVQSECRQQSVALHHIKPHGALYNDAATDLALAKVIAEEIASISDSLKLMGLAESAMLDAANAIGIDFIHEGFMDRNYQKNKTLVPRTETHALHSKLEDSLEQALRFAQNRPITLLSGEKLSLTVDSICLHGDNPDALIIAQKLQQLLHHHNINISLG